MTNHPEDTSADPEEEFSDDSIAVPLVDDASFEVTDVIPSGMGPALTRPLPDPVPHRGEEALAPADDVDNDKPAAAVPEGPSDDGEPTFATLPAPEVLDAHEDPTHDAEPSSSWPGAEPTPVLEPEPQPYLEPELAPASASVYAPMDLPAPEDAEPRQPERPMSPLDPTTEDIAIAVSEETFAVPLMPSPFQPHEEPHDELPPNRFLDRELSWLAFNERVLELAEDPRTPLLERARFLAIFASNLDEFFMVRVAGLKRRIAAGFAVPSATGMSSTRLVEMLTDNAHELMDRHAMVFHDDVRPSLAAEGIHLVRHEDLEDAEQGRLRKLFRSDIFPVLTPLAVDPPPPQPQN